MIYKKKVAINEIATLLPYIIYYFLYNMLLAYS
jgi:hypothetical protein